MNKKLFKRYSTYINLASLITAAMMTYVPQLGLSGTNTAILMMLCSGLVTVSQFLKQEEQHDSD